MAGSPTCGKMSTGMRWAASTAPRAIAISATTTVIGLPRAARTKRIVRAPLASLRCLSEKRLNVAARRLELQARAPHAQARQSVVDLSLNQQALRLSDIIDRRQPGLVSRGSLLKRNAG